MTAIHGRFSRSQAIIENGERFYYQWSLSLSFILIKTQFRSKMFSFFPFFFKSTLKSSSSLFPPDIGADIDCEDNNGNTPLHIAARYGHELLINTLITNGADTAK